MKYFAVLLLDLSLQAPTVGLAADRTITWHPWQEWAEFRVRTGDRYLGADRWEHSLGFELYRPSPKKIQISMISLAGELVPDVVIVPGETLRNSQGHHSNMTAHRGRWSWTAQEIGPRNRSSHLGLIE